MSSENTLLPYSTMNEDTFKNLSSEVDWFGFENRVRQVQS